MRRVGTPQHRTSAGRWVWGLSSSFPKVWVAPASHGLKALTLLLLAGMEISGSCLLHTGQAGPSRFLWDCWLSRRASRGTACLDLRSSKGSQAHWPPTSTPRAVWPRQDYASCWLTVVCARKIERSSRGIIAQTGQVTSLGLRYESQGREDPKEADGGPHMTGVGTQETAGKPGLNFYYFK